MAGLTLVLLDRTEAAVDGVVVCLGPVLHVIGDIGHRLALVGHTICQEGGGRLATM